MSLSEDEKGRLSEIEAHARATDPGFVRRLNLASVRRRHGRLMVTMWCLCFIGFAMLTTGASAAAGIISIGVLVAICGGALFAWSGVMLVRYRGWHILKD